MDSTPLFFRILSDLPFGDALAASMLVLALAAGCTDVAATTDASDADAGAGDASGGDADAGAGDASVPHDAESTPDAGPREARLIALSREGRIASLDIASPWTVRASADLGATVRSARCRGDVCIIVHPSPVDALTVVDARDLSVTATIALERGADPRDVALVDDHTMVVSQYGSAELVAIDLVTREATPISLAALADADGLPEATTLASCGRRVFAQLRRVDHETGTPADVAAVLAVIDLDRGGDHIVDADPVAPGAQGIALAIRPAFDMPTDCDAGLLYVAEPRPLMQGGSRIEEIDLVALTASPLDIDVTAELGGFEVVAPDLYWVITHTEFGPGPSSHLNLVGGPTPDTHNTFASEHVNDLALDREEDLLFFPDPCMTLPTFPTCDTGIVIFDAHTGARAAAEAIDVGFAPIELAIAR